MDRWQAVKLEAEGTPFWVVKDDGGQWELYHAAREAPESLHVSVSEAKRVVEEKLGCAVEWREMNWAKRLVKAYVRPYVFHKEHFWRCYADLDNGIRVEAGGVAPTYQEAKETALRAGDALLQAIPLFIRIWYE